jgi:hypothetical protein
MVELSTTRTISHIRAKGPRKVRRLRSYGSNSHAAPSYPARKSPSSTNYKKGQQRLPATIDNPQQDTSWE